MTLDEFDALPFEAARSAMLDVCGCEAWAVEMAARRPYDSLEAVHEAAEQQWWQLGDYGWLEAFRAHPVAGAPDQRAAALSNAAPDSDPAILDTIAGLRHEYYATFGFTFVYCAEGKTPEDVLEALKARVENRPEEEMAYAAEEQARITQLRLDRLFRHAGD
jgi:2-oxo-4-hydroxy-4-carboxy-5-ureidoimidazoline decarboxylase